MTEQTTDRTRYRWRGGDLWNAPRGTIKAYAIEHGLRWNGYLGSGLYVNLETRNGDMVTVNYTAIRKWTWKK